MEITELGQRYGRASLAAIVTRLAGLGLLFWALPWAAVLGVALLVFGSSLATRIKTDLAAAENMSAIERKIWARNTISGLGK